MAVTGRDARGIELDDVILVGGMLSIATEAGIPLEKINYDLAMQTFNLSINWRIIKKTFVDTAKDKGSKGRDRLIKVNLYVRKVLDLAEYFLSSGDKIMCLDGMFDKNGKDCMDWNNVLLTELDARRAGKVVDIKHKGRGKTIN